MSVIADLGHTERTLPVAINLLRSLVCWCREWTVMSWSACLDDDLLEATVSSYFITSTWKCVGTMHVA